MRKTSRNSPCAMLVPGPSWTANKTAKSGRRPLVSPAAAMVPMISAMKMRTELEQGLVCQRGVFELSSRGPFGESPVYRGLETEFVEKEQRSPERGHHPCQKQRQCDLLILAFNYCSFNSRLTAGLNSPHQYDRKATHQPQGWSRNSRLRTAAA